MKFCIIFKGQVEKEVVKEKVGERRVGQRRRRMCFSEIKGRVFFDKVLKVVMRLSEMRIESYRFSDQVIVDLGERFSGMVGRESGLLWFEECCIVREGDGVFIVFFKGLFVQWGRKCIGWMGC